MRLVLDTNVWLDWLVFGDPGIAHVERAVAAGRATVWIDDACRNELARVLAYPLRAAPLGADAQAACLARAAAIARAFVHDTPCAAALPRCRDPDDQKFMELAFDCAADVLMTKDNALLELGRRRGQPLPFLIAAPSDVPL